MNQQRGAHAPRRGHRRRNALAQQQWAAILPPPPNVLREITNTVHNRDNTATQGATHATGRAGNEEN